IALVAWLAGEQLDVPLLFLPRPARQPLHELAVGERIEGLVHLDQRSERMQSIGALLQLAGCLGASEHEHGEQRDLWSGEGGRLVEEVPVLDGAAPRAAREAGPPTPRQALETAANRRLVVGDDGVAIRRLVTRRAKRVQRQRIDVRRRALLLD